MLNFELNNESLNIFHNILIINIESSIKIRFRLNYKIFVVIKIRHNKKKKHIVI